MRKSLVTIRFALYGCKNRPFFYIVATNRFKPRNRGYLEQDIRQGSVLTVVLLPTKVGTFDPFPNTRNEKLASLNMDRIRYWLSVGARPSRPVAILLGLAGVLPPHPRSLVVATRNRQALATAAAAAAALASEEVAKDEQAVQENVESEEHVENEGKQESQENEDNQKDP